MKRALRPLALLGLLAAVGCGGAKPVKTETNAAAVDAVKARAQESHESLDRGGAAAPRNARSRAATRSW